MDNDFGFFFEDEPLKNQPDKGIEAAKLIYKRIDSLLVRLEENPDKPTINWPDRSKHIVKFRKELLDILNKADIIV